ncbi:MAG: class I SAM-dependent methyltransferase [Patescibacteria group bacterium]|nr:class I SAM-dependent methyltransferase [Patescibacteria group bacterium]
MEFTPAKQTYNHFAPYYDTLVSGFTKDKKIWRYCSDHHKPPIIEIGCGTGRVIMDLLPHLASKNHKGLLMVGVDISDRMLDICHQKTQCFLDSGQLSLKNHNYIDGPLHESTRFNLALITWFTLNYMTAENQIALLSNLRHNLIPNSLLAVDLFYPDSIRHPDRVGRWIETRAINVDGALITLWEHRHMLCLEDWGGVEERIQRFVHQDGSKKEVLTHRTYITPQTAKAAIEQAGYCYRGITHQYRFPPSMDLEALKPNPPEKHFVIFGENVV